MAGRGLPTGVTRKHSRKCPAHKANKGKEGRCRGDCPFQAQAGPRANRQTMTFKSLEDAVAWKAKIDLERESGGWRFRTPRLGEAVDKFLQAARDGAAVTRSGTVYRPRTITGYERELRAHFVPRFGDRRATQLTRGDLLALVGELQKAGAAPSTVRNVLVPVRALYRYLIDHELGVTKNPTVRLSIPKVSMSRRRDFADRHETRALLDALPVHDRPLWACAFYAGLRCGELQALRWRDVDLARRMIRVVGSFDRKSRVTNLPKTEAGAREVPIPAVLQRELIAHRSRTVGDLVFARGSLAGTCRKGTERQPFCESGLYVRSSAAWEAAGLRPLSLHPARHSYGSMMLATGTPMAVVSELLGHSTIAVTVDIYGHTSDETKHKAADALDEHVGGAGPHLRAVDDEPDEPLDEDGPSAEAAR